MFHSDLDDSDVREGPTFRMIDLKDPEVASVKTSTDVDEIKAGHMSQAVKKVDAETPEPEVHAELHGSRRAADVELRKSLAEITVAQSELRDMTMRAIVAAETVATLSTLVDGSDGVAIREVAEMILETCRLADQIGQRMSSVDRALKLADRRNGTRAEIQPA